MLETFAVIAGIIGIIGSIVPGLPGPPVGWVGLLLVYLTGSSEMTTTALFVWLAITLAVTIMDYVVPALLTRATGGSKTAGRGALVGLILGLIYPPIGIFIGTMGGAFLAELLIENKGAWQSFKSSIGAFMGFIFGTGMKLACSGVMMYYIIKFIS
ncbi:MAG: DUF456 domain-containing protein [Bacteroidales bacterium]|nr:DUF456 domain-containing protein [Bacteroidales bacterium]